MLSATRIDFAKMEMTLDANEELPAVELSLLEETFLKFDKDFSGYVPHPPIPTGERSLHLDELVCVHVHVFTDDWSIDFDETSMCVLECVYR